MDIKGERDINAVVVGDFNTPLTSMDKYPRQKIDKETVALNDTLDQMDLIHILRAFYPKAAGYTYLSSAYGTFSRIEHRLGHKTRHNTFNKIEIISSIFSDHNSMKPDTNHKKNTGKHTKTWELNNMLLNNEWVNKIKDKIKRYLKTNENEETTTSNLWDTEKAIPRGKFIALQTYLNKQTNKQS